MSRDRLRLLHIRDAIQRIQSWSSGEQHFFDDPMMQDAVIRNLEIIGEAVKALSSETIGRQPNVPWSQIGAMRVLYCGSSTGLGCGCS